MPRRGFPGGVSQRRIATYGQEATFRNETVTVDTDTDWDDASTTVEETTAMVLQKTRTSAQGVERDQRERQVREDRTLYVADDDLNGFSIREPGDQPGTEVTLNNTTYNVEVDYLRSDGTHELQVTRE